MLGMPDVITALSFDNAVMSFGLHIENKLNEVDPVSRSPMHNLRDLLDIPYTEQEMREQTRHSLAALDLMSRNPGSGIRNR